MGAEALDRGRLNRALDALADRDPAVAAALDLVGYPEPRVRPADFSTLLRIIVAQQLSTRAAAAIWAKLEAAAGASPTPARILDLGPTALRACGLSARKIDYARGLARAVDQGTLALDRLHAADDADVIAAITALKGFGRWSAEIYLLFALGRVDAFPADDLALQVGYQKLKRLRTRPDGRALRLLVEPWAPWRGAGALLLWRVYGAATLDLASPAASSPRAGRNL